MNRKPDPTDLTDLHGDNVEHLFPPPKAGGRPRKYGNREIVAAIFYALRADYASPLFCREAIRPRLW